MAHIYACTLLADYSKYAFVLLAWWCGSNMFLYKYAIINNNIGIIKVEKKYNTMECITLCTKVCLSCVEKISRKNRLLIDIDIYFIITNPTGP